MYGYIYLTTNLINQMMYIGQHKSSIFTEYKGSGKYLKKALNKYGWDNFKVELLEECSSQEELNDREKFWIKEYRDKYGYSRMYNLSDGGEGSNLSGENNPMYGRTHTDSTKKKISEAMKGNQIWLGRSHSSESRRKISNTKTGTKLSEATRKKMSESHSGENHHFYGKRLSDSHRQSLQIIMQIFQDPIILCMEE